MTKRNIAISVAKMLVVMLASLIGAFAFWLLFAFFLSDTVDIDAPRTTFDTVYDIIGWGGGLMIAFVGAVAVPIHMLRKIMIQPNHTSDDIRQPADGLPKPST